MRVAEAIRNAFLFEGSIFKAKSSWAISTGCLHAAAFQHEAYMVSRPQIFVLHENTPWVEPLRRELAAIDAPFSEWFLDRGMVDLTSPPPQGIFYNRMSASSHTRGHRYAPEHTAAVLAWLTRHGRPSSMASALCSSRSPRSPNMRVWPAFGIETPATIAVIGREHIASAGGGSAIRSSSSTTGPARGWASS